MFSLAFDSIHSLLTGQSEGIIKDIEDMATDINNDKFPTRSALNVAVKFGVETFIPFGFAKLATAAKMTTATKVAYGAVLCTTKVICNANLNGKRDEPLSIVEATGKSTRRQRSANNYQSGSSNSSGGSAGAGGQPPRNNRNNRNNRSHSLERQDPAMEILFRAFGVRSLDQITIGRNNVNIFRNLSCRQIEYLERVLGDIHSQSHLPEVIEIVTIIFDSLDRDDVTFPNFLSLIEYIACYFEDCIDFWSEKFLEEQPYSPLEELRRLAIEYLKRDLPYLAEIMHGSFVELCLDIETGHEEMVMNFRNVFTMAYHWFKHRKLPDGRHFTIQSYFSLIKRLLEKIKSLQQWEELLDGRHPRRTIEYELVCPIYHRRIKIVIKMYKREWVVATCFLIDKYILDGDHDEFIDGVFQRNTHYH